MASALNVLSKSNTQRTMARSSVGLSVLSQLGMTLLCSPRGKQELSNSSTAPNVSWAAAEMGAWARAAAQPAQAEQTTPTFLQGQGFLCGLPQSSSISSSEAFMELKLHLPPTLGQPSHTQGKLAGHRQSWALRAALSGWALDCDAQLQCLAGNIFTFLFLFYHVLFVFFDNEPEDLWVCIKGYSVWVLKHQHSIEQNISVRMDLC